MFDEVLSQFFGSLKIEVFVCQLSPVVLEFDITTLNFQLLQPILPLNRLIIQDVHLLFLINTGLLPLPHRPLPHLPILTRHANLKQLVHNINIVAFLAALRLNFNHGTTATQWTSFVIARCGHPH